MSKKNKIVEPIQDLNAGIPIFKTGNIMKSDYEKGVFKTSMIRKRDIVFYTPRKTIDLLNALSKKFNDCEFSICANSYFIADEEGIGYYLDDDSIFVPKQEVTMGGVDYLECTDNYNTVIHKHPDGCTNFSKTDEEYINSNFKFSLLWVNNNLEKGIINIQIEPNIYLEYDMVLETMSDVVDIPEEYLDKINIKSVGTVNKFSLGKVHNVSVNKYLTHARNYLDELGEL